MANKNKSAVVTGVSTGIGRAIAACLLQDGWRVFGSVRKEKDAVEAKTALGAAFTPLIFDVTDTAAMNAAAQQVAQELGGQTLNGLVNNAGISAAAPMRYVPIDDLKAVFDINVCGIVRTSQAFLPLLGADHKRSGSPGKIVNLSSLAGKISVPFMGPYSMSKHAVEALSDAMRVELLIHGIDVVILEPGPIKTPIFDKTEGADFDKYKDTEYFEHLERVRKSAQKLGADGLEPDVVGKLVVQIFNDPSPNTRYPVLKNKFSRWTLPQLMPTRMLDRLLARRVGIKKRKR